MVEGAITAIDIDTLLKFNVIAGSLITLCLVQVQRLQEGTEFGLSTQLAVVLPIPAFLLWASVFALVPAYIRYIQESKAVCSSCVDAAFFLVVFALIAIFGVLLKLFTDFLQEVIL